MKVAIVGSGMMGTATSWPLSDNGHEVRLVGTHLDAEIIKSCKEKRYHPTLKRQIPDGVTPYFIEELATALEDVELIVSGVNSNGVRWIGQTLGPHLRPGQWIIAVTKGMAVADNGDLMIFPDVLYSELPPAIRDQIKLAAIGGPCIAGELAGRRQSCVIFGCRDGEVAKALAPIFHTSYYHVWPTNDLMGLEVGVALKNGYVLGPGLAYGLLDRAGGLDSADANMHNLAAALFAQGCVEMEFMLRRLGGSPVFAYGLPGAGDCFVTCAGGRSMRLGRLLGQGHTFTEARQIMVGETLEAAEIVRSMGKAIPKLQERGILGPNDLPLMRALVEVVVHDKPVEFPYDQFFANVPWL